MSLESCNLEIYGSVQWNKLKSLKLDGLSANADVIHQILGATPQLEVFCLNYFHKGGNLIIQSTSLKELSIIKYLYDTEDLTLVSELRICTPNLETLEILGIPYKKYLLTDVSSLKRAVLAFSVRVVPDEDEWLAFVIEFTPRLIWYICIGFAPEYSQVGDPCFSSTPSFLRSHFPNTFVWRPVRQERLVIIDKKVYCQQENCESLKFEANLPESFSSSVEDHRGYLV
ncbi:hypothetical protein SASPL_127990 [Salvia splendens]|uniref:Uncharacterized protein n=1 Tax=Salvia splendens TaxID=180675 RepID=A0A8X8ZMB7_SALSN|nr:hypothetical protein SASPL_127990 [Salvia splendens]